ncbi:putative Longin domain-containing protein [Helianthus annuus]|nr:putative Longin domain-containing protein [Helianthus annuus]
MAQQSMIYSFVARGTVILAEYTDFSGNFIKIAAQCLQKLPATNNKFTYSCDGHTFNYLVKTDLLNTLNYLVEDGVTYCVVAIESVGRQVPMAFLERIKMILPKKYAGGKAATAVANSLNKEFGNITLLIFDFFVNYIIHSFDYKSQSPKFANTSPKLKEQMQYCMDHREEMSKVSKVKAQVTEVKGVMMENIEKAQGFRTQGTQLRRKMWLKNLKIKLLVLGIIIALILYLLFSLSWC